MRHVLVRDGESAGRSERRGGWEFVRRTLWVDGWCRCGGVDVPSVDRGEAVRLDGLEAREKESWLAWGKCGGRLRFPCNSCFLFHIRLTFQVGDIERMTF